MNMLLIDNSNGRTKFAIAENGQLAPDVRVLPTAELAEASVCALLQGWHFNRVALCSVVPHAAELLIRCLSLKAPVQRISAALAKLPVDFSAYPASATLGADRAVNVVAAAALFPGKPLMVMDAGTATTLDVVLPSAAGGRPRYIGGSIAPGLGTLAGVLHHATAQLPSIPLSLPEHAVGRNTAEAMQSGCVLGYRGMLREIIASAEAECAVPMTLVATGGDAPLLAQLLPEITCIDPLLTLRGIALCSA